MDAKQTKQTEIKIMSRVKRPENETPEEETIRKIKDAVSSTKTRNEKVSWDRRMNNMVKLLAQLTPIEEQLTELLAQKLEIVDRVQDLRKEMVNECIHPSTHLIVHNDHVVCKFCNRKFSIPR